MDGIPLVPKLTDSLPDGVPADLELFGQGFAREIGSPVALQGFQDTVFDLHREINSLENRGYRARCFFTRETSTMAEAITGRVCPSLAVRPQKRSAAAR